MHEVQRTGFARIQDIVGNPKANPPIPPVIPIGRSTWWAGVKCGRYPKPFKLSDRVTVWKWSDIHALLERE